jgi:lipopolysaccharide/colanic/teichoic acid biosynthesis glycosyltransferase
VIGQLFDRTVALVAVVLLSPLLLVIALAVRLSSPGPVLFRQIRVGLRGRPFAILKFRSMVDGADRIAANVSPDGDPRVTAVGRFLRRWYLDELPQLLNVLKGDMSLVGPRPETPEYVALYTPSERRVLEVRPGLAGPSTLAYMDEAALLASVDDPAAHYRDVLLHERVQLDIGYLEKKSVVYDVGLLLRQVVAIARH